MLNNMDDGNISFENNKDEDGEDNEADMTFGLGSDVNANLNRLTKKFNVAKSRSQNAVSMGDYLLNPNKREDEDPLQGVDESAYSKALFYMYGACESVDEEKLIVHNLLRRFAIWDGSQADAEKYLTKQIVVSLEEDEEEDLTLSTENIIRFLNKHSKLGKTIREIEEIGETLSATLYKIVGSEEEMVIKVPKKIESEQSVAF